MEKINIYNLLTKVGMKFFVDYYSILSDNNYSVEKIIELVKVNHKDYSIKAIKTRISKSRKIISNGYGLDALNIIQKAEKIDDEIKEKIKKII